MDLRNRPIGIFDSGVGGLTVVKEIEKILPGESIVYFGDTARVPYGTKSKDTVNRFSRENIKFLLKFKVKAIVVACNTSSSLAIPALRREFNLPIIGVIEPGTLKATSLSKSKRIGVIGTKATISSGIYETRIKSLAPQAKVFSKSCPLFVPLAEEGWLTDKITRDVAKIYLESFRLRKVDTLILGCTHYPLLKGLIKKVVGKNIKLVDSASQTAKETKNLLVQKNLLSKNKKIKHIFFVSDDPANFIKIGRMFLGEKIQIARKV